VFTHADMDKEREKFGSGELTLLTDASQSKEKYPTFFVKNEKDDVKDDVKET